MPDGYFVPGFSSRQKYTRCPCMCSPAKPPAALRMLLHKPTHMNMPTQNPALCKYRIPLSCRAIYPSLVALAAKTLILRSFRFLASRTVIAMKDCNHLLHTHGRGRFYPANQHLHTVIYSKSPF